MVKVGCALGLYVDRKILKPAVPDTQRETKEQHEIISQ